MTYSAEEKYREATRELLMRQRVFPRLVSKGSMMAKDADEKIAIMAAIAADYEQLAKKERLV